MVLLKFPHFLSVPASRRGGVCTSAFILAASWNLGELSLVWDADWPLVAPKDPHVILICSQHTDVLVYSVSINSSNPFSSGLSSLHFPQICLAKLIHDPMTRFHDSFSDLLYFLLETFLSLVSRHVIPSALTSTPLLRSSIPSLITMEPHFT